MGTERNSRLATVYPADPQVSDLQASEFVPVAIPARFEESKHLQAYLEAYEIPSILEPEHRPSPSGSRSAVPVLVPEYCLEQASQIVAFIELRAIDDGDTFEDLDDEFDKEDDLDELEDEEDDEDEFDELEDEEDDEDEFDEHDDFFDDDTDED